MLRVRRQETSKNLQLAKEMKLVKSVNEGLIYLILNSSSTVRVNF